MSSNSKRQNAQTVVSTESLNRTNNILNNIEEKMNTFFEN